MKKRIKFHGFLIFLSLILIAVFPDYLLSRGLAGIKGVLLDIFCALLIIWGYFIRISARGLKSELNPDGKILVTIGPYSLSRNPMYFGTFIIGLGLSLMLFLWWVALGFLAIYLAIYLPLIAGEEKILSGRFGAPFKDYCLKTSKFFPRKIVFRLPAKPSWIKKELLSSLVPLVASISVIQAWADFKFFGSIRLPGIIFTLAVFSGFILLFILLAGLNKKNGVSGKS